MKRCHKITITALVLMASASCHSQSDIDFSSIKSPVIFKGDYKYAYRDPAILYYNDTLYLYFTLVESAGDSGNYWFTAYSKSKNLINWTYPEIITPRDRHLNFSSPGNIIKFKNQWILCLQTYPTPGMEEFGTRDSRIYTMRSDDLITWSEPELLRLKGNDVEFQDMDRMIDPYLVEDPDQPGKWWCFYKQNGISISYSSDLKNWIYSVNAKAGENVTILKDKEGFIMFHSPRNGIGIKRSKHINHWGEQTEMIFLGQDDWDWAEGRITAATVINLSNVPGIRKYLMFFHGESTEGREYSRAHGFASIGIAWSDDLKNWNWPK